MDVDDRTKAIMERAKQRKAELESEESKENTGTTPVKKDIELPVYRASPVKVRETNIDEDIIKKDQQKEHRRSVFADLAEEYEEFSHLSPQKTRVLRKEDYIKGKSPRLSIGETRPSVLCTPAGFAAVSRSPNKTPSQVQTSGSPITKQESEETRQIRFAHPISTTSTYYEETSTCMSPAFNESTIVAGHLSDTTFQSTNTSIVKMETTVNESQDCGAHLFIRKKTPTKSSSSSSLKVCSPQPFVRGGSSSSFSRVLFNPSVTSSPKSEENSAAQRVSTAETSTLNTAILQFPLTEKTTSSPKSVKSVSMNQNESKAMSPVRLAAKESAAAKNIANMLEERIRGTPTIKLPVPKTNVYPTIPTKESTPSPAVLTQWRGATNTPVVAGANPGEPTKPDVRASNINKLKNRWEFSSITGTPLHPDESEDALVKAAIKMKNQSTPKTHKTVSKVPLRKEPSDRSATSSPVTKSPRCEVKMNHKSPYKSPAKSPSHNEEPEEVITEDLLDSEESSIAESEPNYSRAIDDAFEFMKTSPNKTTPSRLAPLATPEATPAIMKQLTPPKPERQFLEEKFDEPEEPKEPNAGLQYTVSFYRKRTRQEQAPDPNSQKIDLTSYTAGPTQQVIGGTSFLQSIPSIEEQKRRLQDTIYAQKTKIHQASKALQLCRNKEEFRGSHEEATAQWAVLVETEIGRAAENELQRLSSQGPVVSDGPLGSMTLSYIALELNRDFVDTYSHIRSSNIFYFCLILRSGDKVLHSTIVSSEEAVKKGVIEVVNPMTLKDLPTNFMASLDVYSFRTVRGQYTHEEKFGLKGSTMKSKGTSRQMPASHVQSDSSFQLVGRLALDIHVPNGKKRLLLSDARHPIEGHVTIKIKKLAMSKTTTKHSGFLSMFQRTKEGLGSWNRYWCVLEEGGMKFWRSPEDEINDKSWLVLLDLQTCAGDRNGAVEARDPCQYMHSFNIDVWIPRDGQDAESLNRTGRPDMEKLRVMLAADTKESMRSWLESINTTVKQLLTWNQPFAFVK